MSQPVVRRKTADPAFTLNVLVNATESTRAVVELVVLSPIGKELARGKLAVPAALRFAESVIDAAARAESINDHRAQLAEQNTVGAPAPAEASR